jgi:cyclomaltodextrinase / maltogenic alpha-amylase / neopullulanase
MLHDRAMQPTWVQHAVFWHVYPLGFVGAEATLAAAQPVTQRLQHMAAWLDYAVELGCSALMLGPIFRAQSHGYDTLDHFQIDPRLGDERDFEQLAQSARSKGLKLVLDGVFNHVGREFPHVRDAAHAHWFKRHGNDFETFEGHSQLVALNHDEPEVAAYVTQVMKHWLSRGVHGFRLDAAYAVPSRFWQRVLPDVRREHPEAWFVGEVIHGDYVKYVQESSLDSVTQYELWKAIWSAINDKNFFELAHALERHAVFVEQFLPLTFVGNHDVTRIASKLTDERHLAHALVALFTLPGIPSVYAGDEQAFRGVKEERLGGDDAIRPRFPANKSELLPYGWPIYRLHQALIGLRRRHAWLQSARVEVQTRTNPTLSYRCSGEGRALRVALNLSDQAVRLEKPVRNVLLSSGESSALVPAHGYLIGED